MTAEPGLSTSHVAYVALGANLGQAQRTVRQAIEALKANASISKLQASRLYRSAPVDASGPDYINAVVCLHTTLPACELWQLLQQLEAQAGRSRSYRNAPRTLDLDLILYDDVQMHTTALTVPHPRMHQRAFVLMPLAELAPNLHIPGKGPLAQLIASIDDQQIEAIDP